MPLEVIHQTPETPLYNTPLLFVHGAWHGAWCWEIHFLPYFVQQGYQVYALSLRGHGRSTPAQSVRFTSIMDYVADVIEVADRIERETGQRPVVIGHSMGGYIVQKYLEQRTAPAAVLLATIPINGALAFTLRTFRFIPHAPLTPLKILLTLKTYPLVGTPKLARLLFFSESMPLAEVEKLHPYLQNESLRIIPESVLHHRPKPKAVHPTPMLVVAAEDDKVFTIKEEQNTAKAYGAEFVLLKDLAHDVMLDTHWQWATDAVQGWLAQQFRV